MQSSDPVRIPYDLMLDNVKHLLAHIVDRLAHTTLSDRDAEVIADNILYGDMASVKQSHGINLLKSIIIPQIKVGAIRPNAEISVDETSSPTQAYIQGGKNFGQVLSDVAIDIAIRKAMEYGMSSVTVGNGSHFGAAGYWTRKMAMQGLEAQALINSSSKVMPVHGSCPYFGTDAWSITIPSAREELPFDYRQDMATSPHGQNVFTHAKAAGHKEFPAILWHVEKQKLTRDPGDFVDQADVRKNGKQFPIGLSEGVGHKGMCLTMSAHLMLSSVHPVFYIDPQDFHDEDNVNMRFDARRIDVFLPAEEVKRNIEHVMVDMLKKQNNPLMRIPGQQSERLYNEAMEQGIPYDAADLKNFDDLLEEYDVEQIHT